VTVGGINKRCYFCWWYCWRYHWCQLHCMFNV